MGLSDDDSLTEEMAQLVWEEERKSHPDYEIEVYCDQHLGVQMRLAKSWSIGEFGEFAVAAEVTSPMASADVNRTLLWKCPKPYCRRCYEPRLLGYFWFGGVGTRNETNPKEQHQCGEHEALPFMYIGRSGQDRRYFCPFHQCSAVGDLIATSVIDEDVPTAPVDRINKDDQKRKSELAVFWSFARAEKLLIEDGSAKNELPPKPDIGCSIGGRRRYYELGRIISGEVAAKLDPNRRTIKGGFSFDQSAPFVEVIGKKLNKNYETEGSPVELILHFDPRFGTQNTVRTLIMRHGELLNTLALTGPFSCVSIFDELCESVVWSKAKT